MSGVDGDVVLVPKFALVLGVLQVAGTFDSVLHTVHVHAIVAVCDVVVLHLEVAQCHTVSGLDHFGHYLDLVDCLLGEIDFSF